MPTSRLRLDVQGLRAIAVVSVVAFHAGLPVPGGFVGVDIFFVISGFVIAGMLNRELLSKGSVNLNLFYLRRAKRLAPALAVVLVFGLIASFFILSPFGSQQVAAITAASAIVMGGNVAIEVLTGGYFGNDGQLNPFLHTWSLSVEEQFYLVYPPLLVIAWALLGRKPLHAKKRAVVWGLAALASLSFVLSITSSSITQTGWSALFGFYSPVSRAWEFAAGAALALGVSYQKQKNSYLVQSVGLLGFSMIISSFWLINEKTIFPGFWALLPVFGTCLVIYAGTNQNGFVQKWLSAKPLVKVGDWSYSIYLWHWPFVVFANWMFPGNLALKAAAVFISLPFALASFRWVENPIRKSSNRLPKPQLRNLTTMIFSVLAFSLLAHQAAETIVSRPGIQDNQAEIETMTTGQSECQLRDQVSEKLLTSCTWNVQGNGSPVYLVGDSTAQHFSDGLILATSSTQQPLTTIYSPGCPLADVFLRSESDRFHEATCRAQSGEIVRFLSAQPPGVVIISNFSRYWRSDRGFLASDNPSFDGAVPPNNGVTLTEGLVRTVESLEQRGHYVVLLQSVPIYVEPEFAISVKECLGWEVLAQNCSAAAKMPLWSANEWQLDQRTSYLAVGDITSALVHDFRPYFCASGECQTRVDGVDHYKLDGLHLNRAGSAALQGELRDVLSQVPNFSERSHFDGVSGLNF